jgi:hypothetical protein
LIIFRDFYSSGTGNTKSPKGKGKAAREDPEDVSMEDDEDDEDDEEMGSDEEEEEEEEVRVLFQRVLPSIIRPLSLQLTICDAHTGR